MLTSLTLQNFRNYREKKITLTAGITIFTGANAVGKTNILEAIYALCIGKSFRAEEEIEVIRETKEGRAGVARIEGKMEEDTLEIIWDGRGRFQKLYKVNGVGKRQLDFVGHLRAVVFLPTDIEIVIGTPAVRRKYLDLVLSQIFKEYRAAISIYSKAIRSRNRLLLRMREEGLAYSIFNSQITYWNQLLIENGEIIHQKRKAFLEFVSNLEGKSREITLKYDHSIISAARLARYEREEIAAATTLVGPHRDDFAIFEQDRGRERDMRLFGSRGEQRLAVLTMKAAELSYILRESGERPMLLLDDIFSELDSTNRHLVMSIVAAQQTVMTTTDLHKSEREVVPNAQIVELG